MKNILLPLLTPERAEPGVGENAPVLEGRLEEMIRASERVRQFEEEGN